MSDGLAAFAMFVALIIVICVPIFALAYFVTSYSCSSKAQQMGVEYRYSLGAGCMIKPKGEWVPLENYRVL